MTPSVMIGPALGASRDVPSRLIEDEMAVRRARLPAAISSRCKAIASVLCRPVKPSAPLPCCGQWRRKYKPRPFADRAAQTACATLRPNARDLILLANASLRRRTQISIGLPPSSRRQPPQRREVLWDGPPFGQLRIVAGDSKEWEKANAD